MFFFLLSLSAARRAFSASSSRSRCSFRSRHVLSPFDSEIFSALQMNRRSVLRLLIFYDLPWPDEIPMDDGKAGTT